MAAPDWLTARPVAHRGFHDRSARRLENTLGAATAAIDRGFAIECDLQLTADENVVVFHDDTLDRLTDVSGRVDRKSLAEVKAARFHDSDERIPTLAELLDTIAGKVPLVIEFKSQFTGDRRLERQAAKDLARYSGPVAVMSFDPGSVYAMRALSPRLPRGLTADSFAKADWSELTPLQRARYRHLVDAPFVGASFIAFGVRDLPSNAPLLFKHLGLALLTWTVRTPDERATARRYADQMIFEDFDPDA